MRAKYVITDRRLLLQSIALKMHEAVKKAVEGLFTGGVSLYGCLDMAGNVWEWTRSLWGVTIPRFIETVGRQNVACRTQLRWARSSRSSVQLTF